ARKALKVLDDVRKSKRRKLASVAAGLPALAAILAGLWGWSLSKTIEDLKQEIEVLPPGPGPGPTPPLTGIRADASRLFGKYYGRASTVRQSLSDWLDAELSGRSPSEISAIKQEIKVFENVLQGKQPY